MIIGVYVLSLLCDNSIVGGSRAAGCRREEMPEFQLPYRRSGEFKGPNEPNAHRQAQEAGWEIVNGKAFCPECTNRANGK